MPKEVNAAYLPYGNWPYIVLGTPLDLIPSGPTKVFVLSTQLLPIKSKG